MHQTDELDFKSIRFDLKVGKGQFGEVWYGTYRYKNSLNNDQEFPIAIKRMKTKDDESKKSIKKEANLMKSLKNPYIIQYIGMCVNSDMEYLMILEYAKLGSLEKYLKDHLDFSMKSISLICYQIALAMEYLSSKHKLVHRDLATRNILLSSEEHAKIADFGLSRLMNNNEYYEATFGEKWPLRWYYFFFLIIKNHFAIKKRLLGLLGQKFTKKG